MFYTYFRLILERLGLINHKVTNSTIKIDWKNKRVRKTISTECNLEKEVARYLCLQYRLKLNLDFQYINTNTGYIIDAPIVKLPPFYYKLLPSNKRFINTFNLLSGLINSPNFTANKAKKNNTDIVEVFCRDSKVNNYFYHNRKLYLLDLEDFFFIVKDKDNKELSILEINTHVNRIIKYYQLPKSIGKFGNIIKKHMFTY